MDTQLDIFKTGKNCGILVIENKKAQKRNRKSFAANGLKVITEESNNQYIYVRPSEINHYENNMLSLTSCTDVLQLIRHDELLDRKTKIFVGGQGCVNISTFKDFVDVVNYGRCDGLLDRIIDGYRDESCIDAINYDMSKSYTMRQTEYLYPGESSVGCKFKCKFCQYSHTRRLVGNDYHHGTDIGSYEDNFFSFDPVRGGRYTTAWDGISEQSRFKVNKKISDDYIVEKIKKIIKRKIPKTVCVKIFNIVGYPWETRESIKNDLEKLKKVFAKSDCEGGRVFIMLLFTPFSPEPITPMAKMSVDLSFSWRDFFVEYGRNLYKSKNLEVMILPQIIGPHLTLQRVMVNRGADYKLIRSISDEKKHKDETWENFMHKIYDKYDCYKFTQKQPKDVNVKSFYDFEYMEY